MSAWTITPAPVAPDLDHPDAWAVRGVERVSTAVELANWGHADLTFTAPQVLAHLREQTYSARTWLVATAEGEAGHADAVVGFAMLAMPREGNAHLAYLDPLVHPEHRGQGVGAALLRAGEDLARAAGRTTVIAAGEHPGEPPVDDPTALVAPTGAGRVAADAPGARFARAHGYALEQAERYSSLALPVDPDLVERLHAEAAARAGADYRLVAWQDRAPDERLDGLVELMTRMSTDAPRAELDIREEPWTPERWRAAEAERSDAGSAILVVAAEHVPTGGLAGLSMVEWRRDRPQSIEQGDTIVLHAHRGHRLGMLMKTEVLRRLATLRPDARHVDTWNAEENEHMLAINVALGFRPLGVVSLWQKTLD